MASYQIAPFDFTFFSLFLSNRIPLSSLYGIAKPFAVLSLQEIKLKWK
jgi:hypothetical protein